jgi:hypothetical protein
MVRFITQHWSKFGVLGLLYLLAFISLGTLTNVQLDAMQNQVQFMDDRSGNGR